ncbi:hypothetical protein RQM65_03755 [Pricia sp. S334]|uniref:Uncharacterized protein n=1 Tax=Pricia mediterranea TaxID=3076079 RepID=A0ABU3L213_9FLAO|nr:hypothetical protein [Pricia sp. S334]MDT7827779.1 hypothetical protein [Pricia sp. S334]
MPSVPSITGSIRKPFTANKRLFGLLTVALIVIGLFFAIYYSHIKSNQQHFRESKLQSLDSDFDIISRQLDNDIQIYNSRNNIQPKTTNDGELRDQVHPIKMRIDSIWKRPSKSIKIDPAFDEYMITIKDPLNAKNSVDPMKLASAQGFGKPMEDIYKSTLKGAIKPPDTLFKSNLLNMGVAIPIPAEGTNYQLFGKEYNYETALNPHVKLKIEIIGLVKADRYRETIRKIDPWIIALLTTFLLLSLFGLPYFKMLFIAEDERLSSNDVILSGITVVVGAPIITIVFLALMNHYFDYYHTIPKRLTTLSEKISDRFEEENMANVTHLYETPLQKEDNAYLSDTTATFFRGSESNAPFREHLKFVSKIDSMGEVYYHIALIDKDDIKNTKSLSTRPYFKAFDASDNLWHSRNGIDYVMRPVVSIEDQTEEAVYIVNNEADELSGYRVGASQMKSVHDPILPFGYQFVIADDQGEVWFHSEAGRATLENFFEVSRAVDDVRSAVLGRVGAQGIVNYRDKSKLFHITPIKSTNLSVIALYDIGLLRTRVSEILTLACIAVVLATILLLAITVLSLIIRNPKLGLYRYDRFLFDFLTPKKCDRDTYILLSCLFIGALLVGTSVNLFLDIEPLKVYITCLLVAIWAYLIVYYSLHPYRNRPDLKFRVRDFLLLSVIVFLNILMIKLNNGYGFAVVAVLLQLGCIFIIIRGQFFELPERLRKICRYNRLNVHIPYRYWYSMFLFSWLLLVAVFPTYLIFDKVENLIDTVWSKTDQMSMAQKYIAKERALQKNLPGFDDRPRGFDKLKKEDDRLHQEHLRQGLYPVYAEALAIGPEDNPFLETGDKSRIFREFLWNARPIFDERISGFKALVYRQARDSSWISNRDADTLALVHLGKKDALQVTRQPSDETIKGTLGYWTLKVSGLLLILSVLFSMILFFVDRFFAFRFRHLKPNDFDTNPDKNYVKKFGRMLLDEQSNSGLLLIGLPFSGKRSFATEILQSANYTKDVCLSMLRLDHIDGDADISLILGVLAGFAPKDRDRFDWEAQEVFIVEHLEHNIKSFNANHLKLKVISFLISKRKRVILISEVYPSQIFAFYEKPQETSGLPPGSLEDDFNSWRNILSAFPQVLIGIRENKEKVYRVLGLRPNKKPTRYERTIAPLIEELGHSKFLPTLAPVILSKTLYETDASNGKVESEGGEAINDHQDVSEYKGVTAYEDVKDSKNSTVNDERLDRQRMIMHTQNMGNGYYNDIWNALPTRERYLLYDLAKDGFLNIKNRNSLFSLMKKGLVVWRDRPAIFNYSFKNFIVTSVSLNEALRLENKHRGKGTWSHARIVLYLIIVTTIVFIALGKPELIKDFEALIGTLGGLGVIIPLVSKFLASGSQK